MTDEEKLKAGRGEFNYKGNLIKQLVGGWLVHGVSCSTFDEVEDTLMHIGSILSESIANRPSITVKDGFSCVNGAEINGNVANSLNNYERVSYSQEGDLGENEAKNS